jgi:beta-phosphoglucomutase-like phosphatase (HAD superfamily)
MAQRRGLLGLAGPFLRLDLGHVPPGGLLVERLGLAGQFGAIAGGDEVPLAKPAPDVYLLAARRLEVPPSACTVLEDSENGVHAAKAAGMRCIAVPSVLTRSLDFSRADAVLAGLEHVTLKTLASGVPDRQASDLTGVDV